MQKAPDAFRTISEVAETLDVPQHVLRFWETRFSQIRPMKRAGGRRYYRPQDVDLLRGIRTLLYDEGYTIKGVQKILREHGVAHVIAIGRGELQVAVPAARTLPGAEAMEKSITKNDYATPASAASAANNARSTSTPATDASDASAAAPQTAAVQAGLTEEDRKLLNQALAELAEARSVLEQSLAQEATGHAE